MSSASAYVGYYKESWERYDISWVINLEWPRSNLEWQELSQPFVWRQEEMLSLGSPKLEWSYSQRCAPFIPIQRPPTNDIEHLLWRQSNCSVVRAIARQRIVVNLEHLLPPKLCLAERICVTISPLFLCYTASICSPRTAGAFAPSLVVLYIQYPPMIPIYLHIWA